MTIWPPQPHDLRRPAYKSLAELVIRAVDSGELRGGDQLPTHRNLAYDLGLSVQTVSRAYEELIRQDVIAGEVGRGTFVKSRPNDTQTPYLPDRRADSIIDFSMLKPVFESIHQEAMRDALIEAGTDLPMSAISSFRPSVARDNYAAPAMNWLHRCGLRDPVPSMLLTNGSTSAMTVALMTAANPGDLIVTEELGHHTLMPLARYLGLRIQGLEIDSEGLLPAAFAAACEKATVRAAYLMPTGLGPSAFTMSAMRRIEIVEIARKHNVLIVENDAWGPIQPNRPDPIAVTAPERTFYFTGLSKCIMPGLRFGFLVVPETFESAAANRHLVTNWMATSLIAEIATRWIENGTAEALLQWQMAALGERNKLAKCVLSGLTFNASENGMHIWLPMPGAWSEDVFVTHARLNGVAVAPGSSFQISDTSPFNGVRICLGAETLETLESGLKVLSRLARSQPEPALLAI